MSKLQEIFDRINESKKEQKELKKTYKDALVNSHRFQELTDELKDLRIERKKVEDRIRADFQSEFDKLDTLKLDIENDMMLLSDAVMNQVAKGKSVIIKDEYDNDYEPIFSVKFKKS